MGFFSWDCKVCGHPLLSECVTTDKNHWMNDCVALVKDGSVFRGSYDGYGRLDDMEIDYCDDPECYHFACWNLIGKPTEHTKGSNPSADQGYFFDNKVHDFAPPKTTEEAKTLLTMGELHNQIHASKWYTLRLELLIDNARDIIENFGKNDETAEKVLRELNQHIERRNKKEDKKEAERLGLSYEDFVELRNYFIELEEKDGEHYHRRFDKAEKLGDGVFRLTTNNEVVFDQDFNRNKVTMVNDPYGCIPSGADREDFLKYA